MITSAKFTVQKQNLFHSVESNKRILKAFQKYISFWEIGSPKKDRVFCLLDFVY